MKPIPVESTTLATVAYDTDRELLQLGFRDQSVYHYFDVPAGVHEDLLRASSEGSYFNHAIRDRFVHARVPVPPLSWRLWGAPPLRPRTQKRRIIA
jgi:hypothetical protein